MSEQTKETKAEPPRLSRELIEELNRELRSTYKLRLLDSPCLKDATAGDIRRIADDLAGEAYQAMMRRAYASTS